jgi:hypothetical protein
MRAANDWRTVLSIGSITIYHGKLGGEMTYFYFLPCEERMATSCLNLSRLAVQAREDAARMGDAMSEFPVGIASRYPTINGVRIHVHIGGNLADGTPMDDGACEFYTKSGEPIIHTVASGLLALGDLVAWNDYEPEAAA